MCEFLAFLMVLFGCDVCDPSGESILTVTHCSKNYHCIELYNDVPVRGVQFTLKCGSYYEVETTERTEGFLAQYNKENGKVIVLSLSGAKISPGEGMILKIIFDTWEGHSCVLSGIKIVE